MGFRSKNIAHDLNRGLYEMATTTPRHLSYFRVGGNNIAHGLIHGLWIDSSDFGMALSIFRTGRILNFLYEFLVFILKTDFPVMCLLIFDVFMHPSSNGFGN